MNNADIIGKKAKIVCLTEQLKSINVHEIFPGDVVEIIEYDLDHVVYGPCYLVDDGVAGFYYLIPLKWLEIQN